MGPWMFLCSQFVLLLVVELVVALNKGWPVAVFMIGFARAVLAYCHAEIS